MLSGAALNTAHGIGWCLRIPYNKHLFPNISSGTVIVTYEACKYIEQDVFKKPQIVRQQSLFGTELHLILFYSIVHCLSRINHILPVRSLQ